MKTAISLALIALSLTACQEKRVTIATPPQNLLVCADEPSAPDLATVPWGEGVEAARPVQIERDRLTLDYILAMRTAWGDCKSKVAGVSEWVEAVE